MVDVVICCHDEAGTVGAVIGAALAAPSVGAVIVVLDSCTDDSELATADATVTVAISAGDKGTAMATGLESVMATDVLFLDADVTGLTPATVEGLATVPPAGGMVVGLRFDDPNILGWPPLSGERRLPADFARGCELAGTGYRAELIIDAAAGRARLPHAHYRMKGVANPPRPERHASLWPVLGVTALRKLPGLAAYAFHPC